MSPEIFSAFTAELEKIARVFGEREPRVLDAEVPYETRKARLLRYANKKSKEGKTPLSTALLTGGGVGTGLGAALGGLAGGHKAVIPGAVTGGVGGALVGALLKGGDDAAIHNAKRLLAPNADLEEEIANRIVAQKRMREADQYFRDERRHRELLDATRGRGNYYY